jgi:hypothetical protein
MLNDLSTQPKFLIVFFFFFNKKQYLYTTGKAEDILFIKLDELGEFVEILHVLHWRF